MIKKMAACVLVVSLITVTVYFSNPYVRESPMGPTKTISDTAAADPLGKYEYPVSIRLGYVVDPTGADLSGGETLE
ncbi:hypothetical protein GRP75_27790, partial [Paenibacillus sp. OT2-17]|nr:hypothetical protein [Paenibacillus sp. OT2-17]